MPPDALGVEVGVTRAGGGGGVRARTGDAEDDRDLNEDRITNEDKGGSQDPDFTWSAGATSDRRGWTSLT